MLWAPEVLGARVSSQRLEIIIGVCRASAGESFRFVRACARAVWLPSGIGSQIPLVGLFPFSFCVLGGFGELSLFPFGAASFPFSLLVPGSFPFSLEVKTDKVYKV